MNVTDVIPRYTSRSLAVTVRTEPSVGKFSWMVVEYDGLANTGLLSLASVTTTVTHFTSERAVVSVTVNSE